MKKTSVLLSLTLVALCATVCLSGCGENGDKDASEPSATPIATVPATQSVTTAPTVPTQAPTVATQAPTQSATFVAEISTGTVPATVPTGITAPTEPGTDLRGEVATSPATQNSEIPTTSESIGEPDNNGNYTVAGVVTGFGPNTVVISMGGGEYEFNYSSYGSVSYSDLYDGANVTIVSDGDPSGAGVPNAVAVYIN